jgi:hypothetical protein
MVRSSSGYTIRSWVEAVSGRYRQMIGNGWRFQKDVRHEGDVAVAVSVLDRALALGRPVFVRVK